MNWNTLRKIVFFKFRKKHNSIEPHFEKIIDSLPGNLYWKDQNGIYLGCNENMVKVSNLRSKLDIIGKSDAELWPEYAEQIKENDQIILKSGKVSEEEEEVNGCIYLSTKMPLHSKQDSIIGIIGNSIDITYLKKIESDLRRSNNIKTEFLRNMRHDIRTPMTGIIGCANLIKNLNNNCPKIEEYADILIESSETLLSFLTEVLDSISVNSGDIPVLKKKFDLNLTLEKVINLNQPKAYEKKLYLKLEHDNSIPKYVVGDPRRLYRIVLELVTNALKYTNEGYVTVNTKLAKRDRNDLVIKIVIEDTGIGIPLDKQQDIFAQFERLTPSFQGIYQGSGLGLTLVKGFLNDLGAEIYVNSEPNKGSIFTCVFPLKEALLAEDFGVDMSMEAYYPSSIKSSQLSENPSNLERDPSFLIRILLVEDHSITAKITREMLSDSNYQVDVASNGAMAITLIGKNDYDIVFMDIGLPDMNGYEVTQNIRSGTKNKSVPIIGLTAHVSTEDKQHCLDIGMNTVFIKPLMKEKIQGIFDIFVPKQRILETDKSFVKKNNDDKALLVLTGKVIDLDLNLKLANGNKALASELLSTLVNSFPEEIEKLDIAYKSYDWEAVKLILHKLRGGLSYCGVPRLKEACIRFDDYLKSGKKVLIKDLYQQFLSEFNKVKQKVSTYLI